MIYVSIVEDDDSIRESMTILINGMPDFNCLGSYRDCETGVKAILQDPPDVVLMDIGLPGMSGIEGIRKIKDQLQEIDILVLTVHDDSQTVFQALCAGASGYLLKNTQPARLMEAIEEAHGGGAPMSSQIARLVVNSFITHANTELTRRETEVLAQLCQGKSYRMIAESLFISEETVRGHIKNIYKKLHVSSKSEAVAKAFKQKLIFSG